MESEKFCLRWNDFESNISSAFRKLRDDNDFFDVTLSCENEQIQAHKVILSACSEFFRDILHRNPHQHPLLYLKGVKFVHLQSVLNFMYHGEVNVAQDELNSFLMVAEDLRIKGLTQNGSEPTRKENLSPPKSSSLRKPTPKCFKKDPLLPSKHPQPHSVSTNISHPAKDDDYIQEVVPIKTEHKESPLHPHHHSISPPTEQFYSSQPPTDALATVDDQMVEYVDETYEEDYTAQHQGYQAGLDDPTKGWTAVPGEIDLQLESLFQKRMDGGYQCLSCSYTSTKKSNIKKHVETHMETAGHQCSYCYKQCKTKNTLDTHISVNHREERKHQYL